MCEAMNRLAIGNQVAVQHPRAPHAPVRVVDEPVHDKRLLLRRQHQWRIRADEFDACPVGRDEQSLSGGNSLRPVARQLQRPWRAGRADFQAQSQPVATDTGHRRRISRKNRIDTETQRSGEKPQCLVELGAGQHHLPRLNLCS